MKAGLKYPVGSAQKSSTAATAALERPKEHVFQADSGKWVTHKLQRLKHFTLYGLKLKKEIQRKYVFHFDY